jgi:predicted peptidase
MLETQKIISAENFLRGCTILGINYKSIKMKYLPILTIFFIYNTLNAQDFNLYEKETFVFENDTLYYRILKPSNFDPNKKYPVHLFLHGSGERGKDNVSQLIHGGELFLKKENREKYNSWVIFPQCSKNDRWPSLSADKWNATFSNEIKKPNKSLGLVIKLMDTFIEREDVDKQKVYISGLSMGGMGTYEMLYRRPNMFAAATPICGNGITQLTKTYAQKIPVWIFHGSNDNVVSPKHSFNMAKAIIASGGSPKMTLYENVEHDSWNNAFEEKDFLKWIHSNSKKQ